METTYTLKNFRVFDEKGATFHIAPLTILTGCNSSGKSSVTKSLMLLNPVMKMIKQDIIGGRFKISDSQGKTFNNYKLDFAKGKHKLGNFDRAINWASKEDKFSVTYSVPSYLLDEQLDVELEWEKVASPVGVQSMQAVLKNVTIYINGETYYSYEKREKYPDKSEVSIQLFKNELITALHNLEVAYTFDQIRNDEQLIDAGYYGAGIRFDCQSLQSAVDFFGKGIYGLYQHKCKILPSEISKFCEKFDFSNLKYKQGRYIDWEDSNYKFDIPYGHLVSLGDLMKELDSQSKESIVEYAEKRFIDDVANKWYNTPKYQMRIHQIFTAFVESDFSKFSDFYGNLESKWHDSITVEFGGNMNRGGWFERDIYLIGTGYYGDYDWDNMCDYFDESWDKLSEGDKARLIYLCMQDFAGILVDDSIGMHDSSYNALKSFASIVCAEAFSACELLTEVDFVEIDRSNAQRIYTYTGQGTSFNEALDCYFNIDDKISYVNESGKDSFYTKGSFSTKWLKKLTVIESFELTQAPEGVGYYVYVTKRMADGSEKKITLADVGYGTTPLLSMLIRIEIMICTYLGKHERVTMCIEEPESNMHPNLQSLLADMFVDVITSYPVNFILETHSEYLIRKLQVIVGNEGVSSDKISIHYLNNPLALNADTSQVVYIPISNNGQLTDQFGSGFFDEAINSYKQLSNAGNKL